MSNLIYDFPGVARRVHKGAQTEFGLLPICAAPWSWRSDPDNWTVTSHSINCRQCLDLIKHE